MLKKISEAIEAGNRFLIASHERPDGDAIGSQLALYHLLRDMGKEAVVYSQDVVPENYQFLQGSDRVVQEVPDAAFDTAIVVDCSELDRIGKEARRIGAISRLINIDHHLSNGAFCENALIDPDASATGELIGRLVLYRGWPLTREIAQCLYTTLLTDTGGFRFGNTGAETLRMAAELVARGASPQWISENVYETQPLAKMRLLAAVLPTLTLDEEGRVASLTVMRKAIEETGALSEYTGGFVDYPRLIQGVEIAILYVELSERRFKLSFRSKGNVNVECVARALGGGGHFNAAACRMEGELSDIRQRVLEQIRIAR